MPKMPDRWSPAFRPCFHACRLKPGLQLAHFFRTLLLAALRCLLVAVQQGKIDFQHVHQPHAD